MPPSQSRDFQVFAKPAGAACNLGCRYCYYLEKSRLYPAGDRSPMSPEVLAAYIRQHMEAHPGPLVRFSWHGGEPTIVGLDYFKKVVAVQRRHASGDKRAVNGMQTNGTLLTGDWCRFLAEEKFSVGISMDGPADLHDRFRVAGDSQPTHARVLNGLRLLQKHAVAHEVLCVVNAVNVQRPLAVYRYFRELGVRTITFLPLVVPPKTGAPKAGEGSVPAEAFGDFLCTVFDEWRDRDIGRIKVQIFEEAASTAFDREHALCIFRARCGEIPVVERNGDVYACDHYVDAGHRLGNVTERPLGEMLNGPEQRKFGRAKQDTLPRICRTCEVLSMCNGECPKNRFLSTPDGEPGWNYLCAGYKRFFTHCRPFVQAVAAEWRQRNRRSVPGGGGKRPSIGRNEPCPCGSGKKYKKCCLGSLG